VLVLSTKGYQNLSLHLEVRAQPSLALFRYAYSLDLTKCARKHYTTDLPEYKDDFLHWQSRLSTIEKQQYITKQCHRTLDV